MKTIKTYLAFSTQDRAYICQAYNKKQMRAAGMNMRLEWRQAESLEKAQNEIRCAGLEITNSANVSNFKY